MEDENEITELQKEEQKLWDYLEKKLTKVQLRKVGELVEVNLQLEHLSNQ